MFIYKFINAYGMNLELHTNDDGPSIITSNTSYEYAYHFVKMIEPIIKEFKKDENKQLRLLDVGMGNGNVLRCARELLNADVYGFDINNYLFRENRYEGRTFPETDIRNIPKELIGTFDVAYQRFFSIPFKDTEEVLLSISKALKPDGMYFVLFDDPEYENENSFIYKMLSEIYENVVIKHNGRRGYHCIATNPRINPTVTPIESYMYHLNNEEYQKYIHSTNEEKKMMFIKKRS